MNRHFFRILIALLCGLPALVVAMRAMRFIPRLPACILALQMLAVAASAQISPIRIMPLGDSIADGFPVAGGYRNKLHQSLTAAGYNADFVGTQSDNGVVTLPDSDHEGHNGWTVAQLDASIASWFNSIASPDVILLHIGTNDFTSGTDTPDAINRLDGLITKMTALRPFAHIIVTNLMARDEPYNTSIQAQFNPFVEARVNAQAALGRRVSFLDMRSIVPIAEMPDQLHPNQAGYDHMADAWLTAIESVIAPLGDNLPPGIAGAGATDSTHVVVTFSKPVEDAAAALWNFSINGLTISAATLDAKTKRDVTLTTSAMAVSESYTVTISGVRDRTAAANLIASESSVNFTSLDQMAPAIVTHPTPRSAPAGTSTTFTVAATGTESLAYQWRRDTMPIAGANAADFTLPNVQASHAGSYDVVVTNPAGIATSSAATLTVTGLTEDPLSLRLDVQGGSVLLSYTGSPNSPFTVQRSTDLAQWTTIATVSANAAGAVACADPGPPAGRAFYRLVRITP